MIEHRELVVEPGEAGRRLDRFLLDRLEDVSRAAVVDAIARGRVMVDGRSVLKSHLVAAGERVGVESLEQTADRRVRPDAHLALDVVYEDAAVIAAHKPAGMPAHPLRVDETGTLANALLARYPELDGVGDGPLMAGLVHRIDTDTSGLVLAARTPEAFNALRGQFRAHLVAKTYLAVVRGRVERGGRIEGNLVHESVQPCRMRMLDAGDQPPAGRRLLYAETAYAPMWKGNEVALVKAVIFTGVTHQIRCQLAKAGWPIVGDRVYGVPDDHAAARHLLHAWQVRFRHPQSGGWTVLRADPDAAFLSTAGLDLKTFERLARSAV